MTLLFCDSSFDPRSREGFTAFLQMDSMDRVEPTFDAVRFALFTNTTNTRLELHGVLHGLQGAADGTEVTIFTDCAAIPNLPARRAGLESSAYTSRKQRTLANADLYQALFSECDRLVLTFVWTKGHKPARERSPAERIFGLVDRAARQRLRTHRKRVDSWRGSLART